MSRVSIVCRDFNGPAVRVDWSECPFCAREVGMQGGKFRSHKNSDDVPICPASDLTLVAAENLFDEVSKQIEPPPPLTPEPPK